MLVGEVWLNRKRESSLFREERYVLVLKGKEKEMCLKKERRKKEEERDEET